MQFKLQCTECGSYNIQPFYQTHGEVDNHHVGLNCTECGNLATMPELEAEWLAEFRDKRKEAS